MYENLQQLLLLAAQGKNYDDVLAKVLDFYGEDFDEDNLKAQMKIYNFTKVCFKIKKTQNMVTSFPFSKI